MGIHGRAPALNIIISVVFGLLLASPSWAEVDCGAELGPGGQFVLTQDLVCDDSTDPALTIIGPVKVDLGGYTMEADQNAPPNVGILVEGKGATLKNGKISGFGVTGGDEADVLVSGEGWHLISGLVVRGRNADPGDEAGIEVLAGSNHNRLTHNLVTGTGDQGICVESDDNWIAFNKAIRNDEENFEDEGSRNTWIHNFSAYAGEEGFEIDSTGSKIKFNKTIRNGEEGIELDPNATGNLVLGNYVRGNGTDRLVDLGSGILVDGGHDNKIEANIVIRNIGDGIRLNESAAGNSIEKNFAKGNGNRTTTFDLDDDSNGGPCVNNTWRRNIFRTSNDPCIK